MEEDESSAQNPAEGTGGSCRGVGAPRLSWVRGPLFPHSYLTVESFPCLYPRPIFPLPSTFRIPSLLLPFLFPQYSTCSSPSIPYASSSLHFPRSLSTQFSPRYPFSTCYSFMPLTSLSLSFASLSLVSLPQRYGLDTPFLPHIAPSPPHDTISLFFPRQPLLFDSLDLQGLDTFSIYFICCFPIFCFHSWEYPSVKCTSCPWKVGMRVGFAFM